MKILIINGHPRKESFNFALSAKYKEGAEQSGAEVRILNLTDLNFDLKNTVFDNEKTSEDIKKAQELILWADHSVWFFPIWWYTMPALMKVFLEQTFLSGFAFNYLKSDDKKVVQWEKYLKDKTAHIIATMDAPPLYFRLILGNPAGKTFKASFDYCGIKLKKTTYIGSVKTSSSEQKNKWLLQIEELGKKLK